MIGQIIAIIIAQLELTQICWFKKLLQHFCDDYFSSFIQTLNTREKQLYVLKMCSKTLITFF